MPPQRRTKSVGQLPFHSPPQTPTEYLQAHGRHRATHLLNPTIDRTPAILHTPDNSKLTIHINHPENRVSVSDYSPQVDWSDRGSVGSLNEWRSWVLNHWFGVFAFVPVRIGVGREIVKYRDEEMEWLRNEIGGQRVASWDRIEEDFNAKFAGVILLG